MLNAWPRPLVPDARRRPIDSALRALSKSANKGRIWLGAATLGVVVGGAARRGAIRGIGALAATSFAVNVVIKPVIRRRRPDIELTPIGRRLTQQPWTRSFPSGHAASAAAFTTGLALEHQAAGLAAAPLASLIGYSRIHAGVHHVSDVLVGAAFGAGVAAATQHWWPLRSETPAAPGDHVVDAPVLPTGAGMVVFTNPAAGDEPTSSDAITQQLPEATVIELTPDIDLDAELRRQTTGVRAVGIVGGDGSVASVLTAATARNVPVAVFPAGTWNHFARDLNLDSFAATIKAIRTGQAIAVDVATASGLPFLNTASIGAYPEIVRRRDDLSHRLGKWLATTVATGQVLRRHRPIAVAIDGNRTAVWSIFVGNGRYLPRRPFPTWRPRMDDGLLDVHYLRAGRLSRTRAVLTILAGISQNSSTYHSRLTSELQVTSLDGEVDFALDGEPAGPTSHFAFAKHPTRLVIYRPHA